jgi:formate dehydrogenase assembly factor FdhD
LFDVGAGFIPRPSHCALAAVAPSSVTVERALTIVLNSQEIVTAMTVNDYPEYLALGHLLNQNMLGPSGSY